VAAGAEQAAAGLAGKTTRGLFADEILGVHAQRVGQRQARGETNIYFFSCLKKSRTTDLPRAGSRSGLHAWQRLGHESSGRPNTLRMNG
jgi:hypothetical protein